GTMISMKMPAWTLVHIAWVISISGALSGCVGDVVPCGAGMIEGANGTCVPDPMASNDPDCATALPGSQLRDLGSGSTGCTCPPGTGLLTNGAQGGTRCEPVTLPLCEYADQTNCTPVPNPPKPPPQSCEEFPDQPNCQPPTLPPQAAEEACVNCHAPAGRTN